MTQETKYWEVEQYAALVDKILKTGEKRDTRAGPAYSLFGETLDIDISQSFPLLRGRKIFYKPVLGELAAFVRGPRHVNDFKKFGCNYWDAWGHKIDPNLPLSEQPEAGSLNLDYGNAWINFNGVDQLYDVIDKLRNNPTDRRILISSWRPDNVDNLSLPCCHFLYQWYVRDGKHLDMIWYQRSVDTMVGLPSDIVLAATMTILLANDANLLPGRIKMMLGDSHIYANHLEPTLDYLKALQQVKYWGNFNYTSLGGIYDFEPDCLEVFDYNEKVTNKIKFELNV